jgi:putative ABC transport system permease protein
MIQNLVRLTLRRLSRHKGYAALNVLGLGVGLAVCGVILLFVRHEMSYDAFHEKADRIHLLLTEFEQGERHVTTSHIPGVVASMVAESAPHVEKAVRVSKAPEFRVMRDGHVVYLDELYHADPDVLDVFSFPLLAGDQATALLDPYAIVVDASLAIRLFDVTAPEDALGQTLTWRWETLDEVWEFPYTVTGVMRDVPETTHWRPRGLISAATLDGAPSSMDDGGVATYVLLREGADTHEAFSSIDLDGLPTFRWRNISDVRVLSQPIREIHLHGPLSGGAEARGGVPITRLRIFAGVALLILLLAAVNYVSLATALGLTRTRAAGVQKTLGARSWQVGAEIVAESVFLAGAAAALAIILIGLALPHFASAVETTLRFPKEPALIGLFLLLAAGVGVLAGAYPAMVLSRARPADVFRGSAPAGLAGARVRQALVTFQIGAFIVLIVVAQVMSRQLTFMQDYDLGLQADQVLVIDARYAVDRIPVLREHLERQPAVLSTAGASSLPGHDIGRSTLPHPSGPDGGNEVTFVSYHVSPDFVETAGVELVAGHADGTGQPVGGLGQIYLNVSAAAALGWTPEVAVESTWFDQPILGVVQDFHHASLHAPVEPMMISVRSDHPFGFVLVRFLAGDTPAVLAAAETAWRDVTAGDPLQAYFLDEHFAALYSADRRLADLFGIFAALAILVASLGLFGLAAFTAARRRNEIGIRKVLGASAASIVVLLSRDFGRLILVALLLGSPMAYWVMHRWLEGFAYRIDIGAGVFLLAGGLALTVALLTVSYHGLRAAAADPVKAIRAE